MNETLEPTEQTAPYLTPDGDLNRKLSTLELRDYIEPSHQHTADDLRDEDEALADLVDELRTQFHNVLVIVFDIDSWHLGIYDRSDNDVAAFCLERLAKAGLYVMHAGVTKMEYENGEYYRHGYVEVKAHDAELKDQIQSFYADDAE